MNKRRDCWASRTVPSGDEYVWPGRRETGGPSIGVAAETRYRAIRKAAPTVYLPVAQFSEVMTLITTLVVRTDGRPAAAVPSIRERRCANGP